MTVVSPSANSPASSSADLTCALATLSRCSTPCRPATGEIGQRRQASAVATVDRAPARAQRLDHAGHRPAAQRAVAAQHGEDARCPASTPLSRRMRRARVAAIQHVGRLAQAAQPDAAHCDPIARRARSSTPSARRQPSVEAQSAPGEKLVIAAPALAQRVEQRRAMRDGLVARARAAAADRRGRRRPRVSVAVERRARLTRWPGAARARPRQRPARRPRAPGSSVCINCSKPSSVSDCGPSDSAVSGLGVDLDDQPVGARGRGGQGHRLHQVAVAGAVARVGDDRQVAHALDERDRAQVERVARRRLEGADAALAQDHVGVARRA